MGTSAGIILLCCSRVRRNRSKYRQLSISSPGARGAPPRSTEKKQSAGRYLSMAPAGDNPLTQVASTVAQRILQVLNVIIKIIILLSRARLVLAISSSARHKLCSPPALYYNDIWFTYTWYSVSRRDFRLASTCKRNIMTGDCCAPIEVNFSCSVSQQMIIKGRQRVLCVYKRKLYLCDAKT